MNLLNLLSSLKNLIISCLTTVKYTPLINGKKLNSLNSFRGIKQGDPLSPYLFILSMEYLNSLIIKKVDNKGWCPFILKNKAPKNFHLFFADDIILLGKANTKTFNAMNDVLTTFCEISGMKINLDKSKVWLSKTVNNNFIEIFKPNYDIKHSTNLGNYLGFPLKTNYKISYLNFIIDKINTELQGWKSPLSKTSKAEMLTSTISNLSSHIMKVFFIT